MAVKRPLCIYSGEQKELKTGDSIDTRWTEILSSSYTATPASTSQITMSDTSGLAIGLPLKYTYNGTTYYGIITSLATDSYIGISGAPLNLSYDLTALCVGRPEMVTQVDFFIAGTFADAADTALLAHDMNTFFKWAASDARLVKVRYLVKSADTGASQPNINVRIGGADAISSAVAVANYIQETTVNINTSNYDISHSYSIEISTDANGTNDDAEDLTVSCVIVYI